jgi:plastocyanin
LKEEAEFKDRPLWSSGVTDMTGKSAVGVTVGALTSVDIPEELVPPGEDVPEELPMAFAPEVVKVSPETDVTWTWALGYHSVTAVDGTGESFDEHGGPGHEFTYTFDDVGNYLYFCIPHGTPFPIDFGGPVGEVENLFGMRGAVQVSDD